MRVARVSAGPVVGVVAAGSTAWQLPHPSDEKSDFPAAGEPIGR